MFGLERSWLNFGTISVCAKPCQARQGHRGSVDFGLGLRTMTTVRQMSCRCSRCRYDPCLSRSCYNLCLSTQRDSSQCAISPTVLDLFQAENWKDRLREVFLFFHSS